LIRKEFDVPTIRAFIAIELAPDILKALEQIQARLRRTEGGAAGRWVKPEGIHLTLKFLGDVPTSKLEDIFQAVYRACEKYQPFSLRVADLGCFPNVRSPHVVWVGVHEETGQLAALQQAVEREVSPLGFPPEGRAFTPHLTLARVREEAGRTQVAALGKAVAEVQVGDLAHMQVTAVSVMQSNLKPGGAVYTELFRSPLGGAPGS
jgi:RNA 2',3'-cyclic 3'-phosphodiesterase